jgi:hypothetical protein
VTFAQAKEVKKKVLALAKKRGILCTIIAEEGVFPIDWVALNNPDWFG